MKVAVIHDWLTGMRGGERVLEAILEVFPKAHIYTMVYKKGSVSKSIEKHHIHTSFINKLPFATKLYKHYNMFYPFAVEQYDLRNYDLVISSSHVAAKGVITGPDTLHISYIHTPVRYYWDQFNEYFDHFLVPLKPLIAIVATFFRIWDISNTNRIDCIIANSKFVARRIKKYYNRDAVVIYPPVDVQRFTTIHHTSSDYYVIVSQLVPYKRIDIAIQAFNTNGKKLKIIGKGFYQEKLKHMVTGDIEFLGRITDTELNTVYQHAKGFIFNAVEDFGIAPIEAQAAGIPVIAYGHGGICETVIDEKTGVFYTEQNADSLNNAIDRFELMHFDEHIIKQQASQFSKERFLQELQKQLPPYEISKKS